MTPLDDLFSTDESRAEAQLEKVVMPENQIFTEERTEKHGAFFHFKEVTQ